MESQDKERIERVISRFAYVPSPEPPQSDRSSLWGGNVSEPSKGGIRSSTKISAFISFRIKYDKYDKYS